MNWFYRGFPYPPQKGMTGGILEWGHQRVSCKSRREAQWCDVQEQVLPNSPAVPP